MRTARLLVALAMFAAMTATIVWAQEVDSTPLRTTQPLMENWRFVQSNRLTDEEALAATGETWTVVTLPHTWNAQDAANLQATSYRRGRGWYRLEFATPSAGARHWLEFGAASLVADVWLNGRHLGQHKGGFTAFRFDITDHLSATGANVLLVKTDNSVPVQREDITAIAPLGGDFNVSGGLYRHVALISTLGPAHFDLADFGGPGVYATTTAVAADGATVNVRAKLKNDGAAVGEYAVRISMLSADGTLAATAEQPVSLEANAATELAQDVVVSNPRLWNGTQDPYLYQLVVDLLHADGTPIDRVVEQFGIRQIQFDPEQGFFLNGAHVRMRGAAMHQDALGKAWALTNEDFDASLAFFKEIGANAIRLGHYPFAEYPLDAIDRMGLIAYAETALGLGVTVEPKQCSMRPADEAFVENAQLQLKEMIRQQYNHPAIVMWGIGNETSARQIGCKPRYDNVTPVLRAMHAAAKSEDPSRPTVYSEFPHPVERSGPYATEGITDLFATNRYFLWYHEPFSAFSPLLDALHALTPSQPLGISEYGAGAAITHHTDNPEGGLPEVHGAPDGEVNAYQPEEYAAYAHEQNYRVIESKPYLWGSFVWNMFDFGSANRNEGDVLGVNTKGLVTFDRATRKDPFYFYKANWSSEPVTYIVGRRYVDRAYPVADIKVYSNADSVQLALNGALVAERAAEQCEQRTCVFEDVTLSTGTNAITATGMHSGVPVSDTVEWQVANRNFNIDAGRLTTGYVTRSGLHFGSDDFYVGGVSRWLGTGDPDAGTPPPVEGTNEPLIYKYYRSGRFSYEIPLPDGTYRVGLRFVEPNRTLRVGERVFDVTANGTTLLDDFDILRESGAARRVVRRTFEVEVSGGTLSLAFTPSVRAAVISNLRIEALGP